MQIQQEFIICFKEEVSWPLTFSAGIALYEQEESSIALFDKADESLYEAKHHNKNRIYYGGNQCG